MTTSSGTAATRKKASPTHKEADASGSSQGRVKLNLDLPVLEEIENWRMAHQYASRTEGLRQILTRGMKGDPPPVQKFKKRSRTHPARQPMTLDVGDALLAEVDKWRFKYRFASRQSAIDELIRRGMKAK